MGCLKMPLKPASRKPKPLGVKLPYTAVKAHVDCTSLSGSKAATTFLGKVLGRNLSISTGNGMVFVKLERPNSSITAEELDFLKRLYFAINWVFLDFLPFFCPIKGNAVLY